MATGKRSVTLGILGSGSVSDKLVCDALNDHFCFGPEDAEGYFGTSEKYSVTPVVPAGAAHTSQGVHTVWEWAIRCELPYTVLWDGTGNDYTTDILKNVVTPNDIHGGSPDLAEALVQHLAASENAMLLVISSDGAFDPATADAAASALRAGIPCYDIARSLLEITWRHLPDHEPPEEAQLAVEEDGQVALAVVPGLTEVELSTLDLAKLHTAFTQTEAFLGSLEALVTDQVAELRRSLLVGRSLLTPKPQPVADTSTKSKKTRLEIFNPATNAWEPAGRGRPPKSAEKRRVPA
ncbi:hypothetical protein ABZ543_12900 [Streptomyces roseifaciens]